MKETKEKIINPEEIAKTALNLLIKKAAPKNAAQAQRYFKEKIFSYGLAAKEIDDLGKEMYQMIKGNWDVEQAIGLCEILLPHRYLEAKAVPIVILIKYKNDFQPELFFKIKGWLSRNYCDNWASVDSLCPEAVGTLLEKYPALLDKIKDWTYSPNRWVKRAAAVSFIKLARKGKYLDTIYQVSEMLFPVKDDLVEKANGWLLREAGKTDETRLERFLLAHGPNIPRTTLRYAIERFPAKRRKQILMSTKRPFMPS